MNNKTPGDCAGNVGKPPGLRRHRWRLPIPPGQFDPNAIRARPGDVVWEPCFDCDRVRVIAHTRQGEHVTGYFTKAK